MKILERIVDGLIRQVVSIDDFQFGFVLGRGTTDAIVVIQQLQEKQEALQLPSMQRDRHAPRVTSIFK